MEVRPATVSDAKRAIARWHRHNKPPVSGLFAAAVARGAGDPEPCGVAVVGRPSAQELQDGRTCEITRVATDGAYNACSMLYAACRKAAAALGYRRVYTYTLATESGASLRAAGFVIDERLPPRESWSCPSRPRVQVDLFGNEQRPPGAKVRWVWPAEARKADGKGTGNGSRDDRFGARPDAAGGDRGA